MWIKFSFLTNFTSKAVPQSIFFPSSCNFSLTQFRAQTLAPGPTQRKSEIFAKEKQKNPSSNFSSFFALLHFSKSGRRAHTKIISSNVVRSTITMKNTTRPRRERRKMKIFTFGAIALARTTIYPFLSSRAIFHSIRSNFKDFLANFTTHSTPSLWCYLIQLTVSAPRTNSSTESKSIAGSKKCCPSRQRLKRNEGKLSMGGKAWKCGENGFSSALESVENDKSEG